MVLPKLIMSDRSSSNNSFASSSGKNNKKKEYHYHYFCCQSSSSSSSSSYHIIIGVLIFISFLLNMYYEEYLTTIKTHYLPTATSSAVTTETETETEVVIMNDHDHDLLPVGGIIMNLSRPSQINFTLLAKELDLVKVFNGSRFYYNNNMFQSSSSPKQPLPSWCTQPLPHEADDYDSNDIPRTTGLIYNKMPKAGSSTTSGIVLRIAYHAYQRYYINNTNNNNDNNNNNNMTTAAFFNNNDGEEQEEEEQKKFVVVPQRCSAYHFHTKHHVSELFTSRLKDKSFMFTTVRNPAKRAISRVFFTGISNLEKEKEKKKKKNKKDVQEEEEEEGKLTTSDDDLDGYILNYLKTKDDRQMGVISPGIGGFQINYLTFRSKQQILDLHGIAWNSQTPNHVLNAPVIHQLIEEIMDDYDFIIPIERYDEAIVTMQLLLGLPVEDVLYLPSKTSSTSSSTTTTIAAAAAPTSTSSEYYYKGKKCLHIPKKYVSPVVDKYLKSDEWYAKLYGDYLLQEVVSLSLDRTIDEVIGRSKFEHALRTFLTLKSYAYEQCADKAFYPCGWNITTKRIEPQIDLSSQNCYAKDWGCGYPCLDSLLPSS